MRLEMRLEIKYKNVHENCQWHNRLSWAYEFSPILFITNTALTLVREKYLAVYHFHLPVITITSDIAMTNKYSEIVWTF